MPDRNHKIMTTPRLLIPLTLAVFSLLGACNSQGGEVVRDIAEEAERTETVEGVDNVTKDEEQEITPEIEPSSQLLSKDRFEQLEPIGSVKEKIIRTETEFYLELGEMNRSSDVAQEIRKRLSSTIKSIQGDDDVRKHIIERVDSADNRWFNVFVGASSGGSEFANKLWLYSEVNEEGNVYVPLGEGSRGVLIPIGFSYIVDGESVGQELGQDQVPEGIVYLLDFGERKNSQRSNEIINYDFESGEIYLIDPWTNQKYSIQDGGSHYILSQIMPDDESLLSGLPSQAAQGVLERGLVPQRKSDGAWVGVDEHNKEKWMWNSEGSKWIRERDSFNQEKFMEELGDPEEYTVFINSVEIQPGELFAEIIPGEEGYSVGFNAIVASYSYLKEWSSESGESYDLWMVDLTIPDESGNWKKLPFYVWVDKRGDEPRIINNFAYSIDDDRKFSYGTSEYWENKIFTVVVQENGDRSVVDMNSYESLRKHALKPFEPGRLTAIVVNVNPNMAAFNVPKSFPALEARKKFIELINSDEPSPIKSCTEEKDGKQFINPTQCLEKSDSFVMGKINYANFMPISE